MKRNSSTITAIATPEGKGALAVIRISGCESYDIFSKCINEKEKFKKSKERNIELYTFINENVIIDEITAIRYKSPRSFTGEDMIEIISHGGKITVNEIVVTLIKNGCKIAQRGEFTKRAFSNGKMDLLKAESIQSIIDSNNLIQNRNALNVYYGSAVKKVEKIKNSLIEILCDIESEIEFAEEDDIKNKDCKIEVIKKLVKDIEKEQNKRHKIKEVEKGIQIVIAGPPNAGKSTLYNRILGYNRSIVHEKAGTTRDIITEKIVIKKTNVTIIDSAGIRITNDDIEKEGIFRSENAIEDSSILIWVTAANESLTEEEIKKLESIKNRNTIIIVNKSDTGMLVKENELKNKKIDYLLTSVKNDTIDNIEDEIVNRVQSIVENIEISELIINERHESIINNLKKDMDLSIENWDKKEIASIYINDAIKEVENLTGKISSEEVINNIFEKFCIGK
jgi:tRNA modification GTPase